MDHSIPLFFWGGVAGVSRLIQNKFFRILSNAERICVLVFKEYIVKKKFSLKCISSDDSAENRFFGRFHP